MQDVRVCDWAEYAINSGLTSDNDIIVYSYYDVDSTPIFANNNVYALMNECQHNKILCDAKIKQWYPYKNDNIVLEIVDYDNSNADDE